MNLKSENLETSTKNFSSGFKWNIFGSSFYEGLKILHQLFLIKILEQLSYGLMGSIFSIIYLTVYLTDTGLTYTLPTFFNIFTDSKANFKNIFLKKYFSPQILLITASSILVTYIYSISFLNSTYSPFLYTIPLTIFFESIRIFLRRFLHTAFKSKEVVISESIQTPLYILAVWIPYLFFKFPMTLNLIFIPHLIDSIVGTIVLTAMIQKYYTGLSNTKESCPTNLWPRIFKARLFNYSINISKQFFTGNFLTPFFAAQFGLKDAGIFNLVNHLAESIKSIMKSTTIFSGNALLVKFKTGTIKAKRFAFDLLNKKLNLIIYPVVIFIFTNYQLISSLQESQNITQATFAMGLLFILLTLADYFFIIYDQFYIIEEQSGKLFLFKVLEFLLFYTLIISNNITSPFMAILGILIIKATSFTIIATNAYSRWKIKLNFYIPYKYLMIYFAVSFVFKIISKLF